MSNVPDTLASVVIPNLNGKSSLGACLDSLLSRIEPRQVIVIENGSTDGSLEFIKQNYPDVDLIVNKKNKGFAGGVNQGIRRSMELGYKYVALFNNDAVAEENWLEQLVSVLDKHDDIGIATSKIMSADKSHLDSTGDFYTVWGLPFPRGRGEAVSDRYDKDISVFSASGGASLYRVEMLKDIGLFDEDFFAYYEDVDISFRAQLAKWKVSYVPSAVVYHQIGATSSRIKGFTTYQTVKNLPWLLWKNVPTKLLGRILPRFLLAYTSFLASALSRGQLGPVFKGLCVTLIMLPKKTMERLSIQKNRRVSDQYIWSVLVRDLPPNAHRLRRLRDVWRQKRS